MAWHPSHYAQSTTLLHHITAPLFLYALHHACIHAIPRAKIDLCMHNPPSDYITWLHQCAYFTTPSMCTRDLTRWNLSRYAQSPTLLYHFTTPLCIYLLHHSCKRMQCHLSLHSQSCTLLHHFSAKLCTFVLYHLCVHVISQNGKYSVIHDPLCYYTTLTHHWSYVS